MLVPDPLDVVLAEAVHQHRGALERLAGDDERAETLLEVVAGADRPGGSRRRDECPQTQSRLPFAHRLEDALERGTGREIVGDVVPELRELVEDDVVGILGELVAPVVDLLDVALRARGADDVAGIDHPLLQPGEPLAAHALGKDGDAPASHQPGDGDAAPAVVAGRRPDGPIGRGIELSRDQPRRQAAVGGQHLVGGDQREPVSERNDDPCLDAGELRRQDEVIRNVDEIGPVRAVVPVDPEQVQRVGVVRPDADQRMSYRGGNERGMGELGEGRERDARVTEVLDAPLDCVWIGQLARQAESLFDHSASTGCLGATLRAPLPQVVGDLPETRSGIPLSRSAVPSCDAPAMPVVDSRRCDGARNRSFPARAGTP